MACGEYVRELITIYSSIISVFIVYKVTTAVVLANLSTLTPENQCTCHVRAVAAAFVDATMNFSSK